MLGLLKRFLYDPWRVIDDEARAMTEPSSPAPVQSGKRGKRKAAQAQAAEVRPARFDWNPLVVLVTVCVSLTLQEYVGDREFFGRYISEHIESDEYFDLIRHGWWALWRFLGYVVIPVLVIWAIPGQRVRDCYIGIRGLGRHIWIYVALFVLILPVVFLAPRLFAGFYKTYPFYKLANRSSFDFWAWQAMYAVQFISLEFFFRGYMLAMLKPKFGSGAIFVMVVPYCMIHYGKPMPETLGAIVAGIVLGTLSMRTRSIWGGAFIHIAVALTMDMMAVSECPPAESGRPCPSH